MKKILFVGILITCFFLALMSCSNDDEIVYKQNSLNGTWNLTSYGGGVTGQFIKYNRKDVTWNFDTINNTVLISSKLDYFGPKSGNYSYDISQEDDNKVFYLNDSVTGRIFINIDELLFEKGLIATFKR